MAVTKKATAEKTTATKRTRSKKVLAPATETTQEAVTIGGEFALTVYSITPGGIKTNIADLEAYVDRRMKDYAPELYQGDADKAKKERAELNNGVKQVAERRKYIIAEAMKPYAELEGRLKAIEKKMKDGALALDEIVKDKEERERADRKGKVWTMWKGKHFELVPFEQIWQEHWGNKTAKRSDVEAEMDASIAKIQSDIKTIEALGQDVDEVKGIYLENLDLSMALQRAATLKANRERAAQEVATRAEREHTIKIEQQMHEESVEYFEHQGAQPVQNLVAQALEMPTPDPDPLMTFTLEFTGRFSALNQLKSFMSAHGIEYNKIENGSGRYIPKGAR